MPKFLIDALTIFASVFVGLYVLWSIARLMTPRQRVVNAAIAGAVSAGVSLLITAAVGAA